jgi:erythromycin esterase
MMKTKRSAAALAVLLTIVTSSLFAQESDAPKQEFATWARANAHRLRLGESPGKATDVSDLEFLHSVVGNARVVALGEPMHGGHEPLEIRNQLIQYCVTKLGFTAVALETRLSSSKALYDYVLGRRTLSDAELAQSISFGFGAFSENLELLHWLRSYNATKPPSRQVRVYGTSSSGPAEYESLDAALTYLERAAPEVAHSARADLSDAMSDFRPDKFAQLPQAKRDALAAKLEDLITVFRRERLRLIDATSTEDYEWAFRQTYIALQAVVSMRLAPPGLDKLFDPAAPLPQAGAFAEWLQGDEAVMADNIAWALQREGKDGRLLVYAHKWHLLGHPETVPPGSDRLLSLFNGVQRAGMYLRSRLGRDLIVIGTYYGALDGMPNLSPEAPQPNSFETKLSLPQIPFYFMDLRGLPQNSRVAEWFAREHVVKAPVWSGVAVLPADPLIERPRKAFDAIIYFDRISSARK